MVTTSIDQTMSPLAAAYPRLVAIQPKWQVIEGTPTGDGWLDGEALCRPEQGALGALLAAIASRLRMNDRKVVAGAFALRFGGSAVAAIAPFLVADCVPEFTPHSVVLRFSAETFFERVALRRLNGSVLAGAYAPHPSVTEVLDRAALRRVLRAGLLAHARPVVEALAPWAGLNASTLWGLVASSWGTQFAAVMNELGKPCDALAEIEQFFASSEAELALAPCFYAVEHAGVVRVYHRRGSCCLNHRASGSYCTSCPRIEDEERYRRNRTLIEKSLRRAPPA